MIFPTLFRTGQTSFDSRHSRILVFVLVTLFLVGCETRDHTNPFDPENPETDGHPRVLNAIAQDGSVLLRWDLEGLDDPLGLRILREVEGVRTLLFEQSEATGGEFVDEPLPNEELVRYHLEVQDPSGTWLPTEPDSATPGLTRVWVGDAVGGGLIRLSPDGRDFLRRSTSGDFLDMAVETDGSVLAPNWSRNEVVILDRDGEIANRFDHLGGNAIAVEENTSEFWVGSFSRGSLTRYNRGGDELAVLEEVGPIEDLEAARGNDGGLWVAVRFSGVLRVFGNSIQDRWEQFDWPVSVTEDPRGFVWVIDRATQSVSRISITSGAVVVSAAELGDPVDGTLDGDGGFWVADPGREGLVHLAANGSEIEFLAMGRVSGVTYDSRKRRLWTVHRDEGKVSTWTVDGRELSSYVLGGRPVKVEGNWP